MFVTANEEPEPDYIVNNAAPEEPNNDSIIFNPFMYLNKYSIIEFILIVINNIIHWVLAITMTINNILPQNVAVSLIFICIAELLTILFLYIYDYNRPISHNMLLKQQTFSNILQSILQLIIYFPWSIIIVFVNTNYIFMVLYFIFYSIVSIYQCFMYFQIKNHFAFIYVQFHALIIMICAICIDTTYSLPFFILSVLILHFGCFVLLFARNDAIFSSKLSIIGFILICLESMSFSVFSWQLFQENIDGLELQQISALTFTLFGIVIIIYFCYYYGKNNFIFHFNLCHDIMIQFAMISIILYFYYSVTNIPSYFFSFYLSIIIMVLFECYRFFWIYRTEQHNHRQSLKAQTITFLIKLEIIIYIFGIVYVDHGLISVIFVIMGSIIGFILLCIGVSICAFNSNCRACDPFANITGMHR